MQAKFNGIIEKHKAILEEKNKIFSFLGYSKLLLVCALGVLLYFIIEREYEAQLIILGLITLVITAILWIYHITIHEKINYSKGIIAINKKHLDRISGQWATFSDMGEEFIADEHPYAADLDIVGKKSLFQLLNTTNTWHGRQIFANDLLNPTYTIDQIQQRQQGILELSKDLEFSNNIEYHTSKIGPSQAVQNLVKELRGKQIFIKNKAIKWILSYVPLVSLAFIIYMVMLEREDLYLAGVLCVFIQFIVWIAGGSKAQKYFHGVTNLPYKLSAYSDVFKIIKRKEFTATKLKQIKAQLSTSNLSAEQAIKDLGKISDKVILRNNAVICIILNALYFWDYKCALMLEKWNQKYADMSEEWFLALGEFESLMSFSNLNRVCNQVCFPTVLGKSKTLEAKEVGHPLLSNENRVTNDISLNNNIFIISGSNMSGKTTYLRTVGLNLVLAQSGSVVCGEEMSFSPMKIITSMRVTDDLNEGVSTFYAELKRIKVILELAQESTDMIFLIDEIFKGTNSVDRLSGAKAVISKLNELGTAGIITTHDLDLCDLSEQYSRIINYSFSEYYQNNRIHFNYKMELGKSTTTNAKYLMQILGIV